MVTLNCHSDMNQQWRRERERDEEYRDTMIQWNWWPVTSSWKEKNRERERGGHRDHRYYLDINTQSLEWGEKEKMMKNIQRLPCYSLCQAVKQINEQIQR